MRCIYSSVAGNFDMIPTGTSEFFSRAVDLLLVENFKNLQHLLPLVLAQYCAKKG